MLRTRDPDAVGAGRPARRALVFALGALLCVSGAIAQDAAFWQGQPYRGDEPLPAALATDAEAPLALWSLRITGSTVRPRDSGPTQSATGQGGCIYLTGGSSAVWWNTPVYLPQGANVGSLRVFYNDAGAGNVQGYFTVYDLYGAIFAEWGVSSSGTPGQGFLDTAAINHVVNYNSYSYVINARMTTADPAVQFCGVRIFFEPPAEIFIDGFETGNTSRWSAVIP